MKQLSRVRAAACHLAPVLLSARATTDKCIATISRAAKNSANLVVFPESFIPAFPVWSGLRPPTDNHDFFKRMATESVFVDGDEVRSLQAAARTHRMTISVGISEKVRYSTATLFNSNLIIGPDGKLLVHHRKLMPTFFEKLTWSPGDGHGLRIAETPFGRIGALICGENTNPLARYTLMAMGEQIHVSTWPASWPTRVSGVSASPVAEGGSTAGRNYDNVAANRIRAAAHCFEAKCFGVLCSGFLDANAIQEIASSSTEPGFVRKELENASRAATMFLDPTGAPKPGFTIDDQTGDKVEHEYLQNTEGVLYADLDLNDAIEGKQYHDVIGGYQRLDVFNLKVDRTRRTPVTVTEDGKDVDLVEKDSKSGNILWSEDI